MKLRGHTVGWSLFFLAAIIPGLHLQRNGSSVQPASDSELPSEAQIYQPVLQPSEAIPPIGTYMLKNLAGKPCIKATMGVEYIVIEKKTWYFSLDPSRVSTSGYCGKETALLSLTLPDNAASLQVTFRKEKNLFYVTKLTVHVSPLPVCQGCANKTYSGLVAHDKLFTAANGQSFKCKSENLLLMSSELQIKLVPLQMQAFTLPKGQYGKEVECWADYNKRVIPIIVGATVVCLILIAVLTFLFIKDRHRQGYDRI
ncbi:lysosome-associated membrane glycoprotein 3 isoform X2 [Siniperca chuatsi]|uniref:lysosome-associated membrane glycoprotein 3 isoform X2 n=1 Tax=Siniperca chuatsi TaxID=119488 RepID=UPI001CE21734|nr:lysosome-associated membrane glycoprotein 3 isoform X2 [Siniperca chuatsi]